MDIAHDMIERELNRQLATQEPVEKPLYFYRIKHIPTGLFYTTRRGRWAREKTNLHENGKVYTKKPSLGHISTRLSVSDVLKKKYYITTGSYSTKENYIDSKKSDFKIIKYKLVETEDENRD